MYYSSIETVTFQLTYLTIAVIILVPMSWLRLLVALELKYWYRKQICEVIIEESISHYNDEKRT